MSNHRTTLAGWAILGILACGAAEGGDSFATIDGESVSFEEFDRFVYNESRQTFYHGSPLDEQGMIDFRRRAADKLIDRKLKIREARRRGLAPDTESIEAQLDAYEARYGDSERWQTEGDAMKAEIRAWLEEQSLLEQIDGTLRQVPDPDEDELRAYYTANQDKFTKPEEVRVSVILLRVPPSSRKDVWDAAATEAEMIAKRIGGGATFAEEAREHSDDLTAENGGDLGYVHEGTLGPEIQRVLDTLSPGEMAPEAIRVLEGMVLVRLEDRRPATLVPFDDAGEQALSLYRREKGDKAYDAVLGKLREASDIWIDEEYVETISN